MTNKYVNFFLSKSVFFSISFSICLQLSGAYLVPVLKWQAKILALESSLDETEKQIEEKCIETLKLEFSILRKKLESNFFEKEEEATVQIEASFEELRKPLKKAREQLEERQKEYLRRLEILRKRFKFNNTYERECLELAANRTRIYNADLDREIIEASRCRFSQLNAEQESFWRKHFNWDFVKYS